MKKQDFEVVRTSENYELYYKNEYLDNFSLENESRLFPSTKRLLRIEFNVGYSTNIEHWCIDNFYNEPVEIAISRRVSVRKGNRPHLYQIFLDDKHYYYIGDEMLPYDSLFHLPQWKVDELNDVLCTQFSCDKLESYLLKDFLKDNETL